MRAGSRREPRHREDGGAVFVFVILLVLALLGLGHAVLVVSLAELSASRAVERQVRVRVASEAAVNHALRGSAPTWMDSVPVSAVRRAAELSLDEEARAVVDWRRLAPEAWLIEGTGWTAGGPEERTATLVWALDPVARVAGLPAALTLGPAAIVDLGGSVDASAPTQASPPLAEADCVPWAERLEGRYAAAALAPVATVADTVGAPRLGHLDFATLQALALEIPSGAGTPTPVEASGACVLDAPWAWGDPERRWRPCGGHLALRASGGDLRVEGGAGQGVLLVGGDLTLTQGARFYGLALVRGTFTLEDGARFEGLAWALAGARLDSRSSVRGSACWAARALAAQGASLGRPRVMPSVGPIRAR